MPFRWQLEAGTKSPRTMRAVSSSEGVEGVPGECPSMDLPDSGVGGHLNETITSPVTEPDLGSPRDGEWQSGRPVIYVRVITVTKCSATNNAHVFAICVTCGSHD